MALAAETEAVAAWFADLGLARFAPAVREVGMDWDFLRHAAVTGALGELQDNEGRPLLGLDLSKVITRLRRREAGNMVPSGADRPSGATSGPPDGRWHILEGGEWRPLFRDLGASTTARRVRVPLRGFVYVAELESDRVGRLVLEGVPGKAPWQLRREVPSLAAPGVLAPPPVLDFGRPEEQRALLRAKFAAGWRPCPLCRSEGAASDTSVVACPCGHRFCADCGVSQEVVSAHDNRWHVGPRCPRFCPRYQVIDPPQRSSRCPECLKTPGDRPCSFPEDDGYPRNLADLGPEPLPARPATPTTPSPAHRDSVVASLLVLGYSLERCEDARRRCQSVEACVAWLVGGPSPEGAEARKRCVFEDLNGCGEHAADEIYVVGGEGTGGSVCANDAHAYCYECAWGFMRGQIAEGLVPACPGSQHPDTHRAVGGCGGRGHAAVACEGNCGACGFSALSQIQVEQIMNGFFDRNGPPDADLIRELVLEMANLVYPDNDGRPRRGWVSGRLRQACLRRASRLEGITVVCPEGHEADAPSRGWSGMTRCLVESCRFHALPFCSQCLNQAHYGVRSCDDMPQVTDEWVRWCRDGRGDFLRQTAQFNAQFRTRLEQFDQLREQHQRDMAGAVRNQQDLQQDEAWKAVHCRLCPNCNSVVWKTDGCDSMRCGQNYHGGDVQRGCGQTFRWPAARPYVSAGAQMQPLARFDAQPPEDIQQVRHLVGGAPRLCDVCADPVEGPLLLCANCPADFTLCLGCDARGEAAREVRRRSGETHPANHVFCVHTQPLEADGA